MLSRRQPLTARGDTIVEVMIVLAVLGLAIGISYATANRSLRNARQAQENSQATLLVQSQIEALRTLATAGNPQNIFQTGPYCLSQASPYTIQYGNNCQRGTVPYTLSITYAAPAKTFTATATWPDVLGRGNDTITTVYRLYPQ